MKSTSFGHCAMSMGRRVRACTRLSGPAKALTTRDYVRGISGPSTLLNNFLCTGTNAGSRACSRLVKLSVAMYMHERAPVALKFVYPGDLDYEVKWEYSQEFNGWKEEMYYI
jgi:hypothetical protein